jgi:RAD51-like protein 2
LNVQIPECLGGVEGECLFVDTHGDFSVDRLSEMAKALRTTVLKKIDRDLTRLKQYKEEFLVERILGKIHFMRVLDDSE